MSVRVGTRFIDERMEPLEQLCAKCGRMAIHEVVRETEVLLLMSFPLLVFRDKCVVDCNLCRHRQERNVPKTIRSRPYIERFGLLFVFAAVVFVSGIASAYDAVSMRLSARSSGAENAKWIDAFEQSERERRAALTGAVARIYDRCTSDTPTPEEKELSESETRTRIVDIPAEKGNASFKVYCVTISRPVYESGRVEILDGHPLGKRPTAGPKTFIVVPEEKGMRVYIDRKVDDVGSKKSLLQTTVYFDKAVADKAELVEWLAEHVMTEERRGEHSRYLSRKHGG